MNATMKLRLSNKFEPKIESTAVAVLAFDSKEILGSSGHVNLAIGNLGEMFFARVPAPRIHVIAR